MLATVRKETYSAINLEQGGVEVPAIVLCSISSGKAKLRNDSRNCLRKAGETLEMKNKHSLQY